MRKFPFFAIVAIIIAATMSCGKGYKANIKTDVDTVSYAIGQANGGQLQQFLESQGMDSTCIADFLKGFKEGSKSAGDKKKEAYYMGLAQGLQMVQGLNNNIFGGEEGELKLSRENLIAGLVAGVKKDTSVFSSEAIMPQLDNMINNIRTKSLSKKYEKNKEEGAKFLAENAKKEGVKTLANGVQYKVIKEGNGPIPTDSTTVKIHYEGKTIDGNVFDSSYQRNQPAEMIPTQLVPGFAEALKNMPVGSTWEIYIPAEQAYGEREAGAIKPFSTLIFKVELLDIVKK
jgi:FKBP-type peptidyl-prolyl cis-trans isomerase FklB